MKFRGLPIVAMGVTLLPSNASGFVQNSEGCFRVPTFLTMGYDYSSAQPFGDNAPNHQPGGGYRYTPSPEREYLGSSIDRDAMDRLSPSYRPSGQFGAQQSEASAGMPNYYGYSPCQPMGDNAAALASNYAHVAPSWEYQGSARERHVGSIADASRMLGGSAGGAALPPPAGTQSTAFGGSQGRVDSMAGASRMLGSSPGGTALSPSAQSSQFGGSSSGSAFGSSATMGTAGAAGGMGAGSSSGSSSPFGGGGTSTGMGGSTQSSPFGGGGPSAGGSTQSSPFGGGGPSMGGSTQSSPFGGGGPSTSTWPPS